MLKKWEFIHFPCEKDPLRFKLKIKAREEDLASLIQKLGANCGKPFTSLSKDFNWAFYIYQVEREDRNRIIQIIKELAGEGSIQTSTLEITQELPPILEEFLDETAKTLMAEEQNITDGTEQKEVPAEDAAPEVQPVPTEQPKEEVQPPKKEEPAEVLPPESGEKIAQQAEMPQHPKHDNVVENVPTQVDGLVGMPLNQKYLFQNFIVGPNNRFTHAASQAVAENPGKIYNPLFIYGGVGLGKTHLMHSVGHHVMKKNPSAKVLYISTEKFMGEVIEAVAGGSIREFRDRFRSVDVLLIDDIQFLSESEATQEEFFHTFNHLHENGKQIIITSDRPPKQLMTLEDRLRSRFEWGLIADVKSPNLETRVAILKRKSFEGNFALEDNMLLYIASKLKSNIRELEGFLKRINAYAELTNKVVDMELVTMIMKELLPEEDGDDKATMSAEQAVSNAPVTPSPQIPPATMTPPVTSAPPRPVPIGFSVPPATAPLKPQPPSVPPISPGLSASKFGGDDIDPSLAPIEVGFYYPDGQNQEFLKMKEKFKMIIKKHKLKFYLNPLFEMTFAYSGKVNYAQFVEQCKKHKVRILIILGTPPDAAVSEDDFANLLGAVMEDERISLQLVPWRERAKDYRYLNLSLDITLLRHRKSGN